MDESFDSLPPYPGVAFPTGPGLPPSTAAYPAEPPSAGAPPGYSPPPTPPFPPDPAAEPSSPSSGPSRRWLGLALGGGAVLLAAGAFLLGHATAPRSSTAATNAATNAATLNALTSAPTAATNGSCAVVRRVAAGTLKSVSGSTLTVSNAKGTAITVKTNGDTKVTQVVKGTLGDVTKGATVVVQGNVVQGTGSGTTIAASHVDIAAASPAGPHGGIRSFGPRARSATGSPGVAIGTVQGVSSSGFTLTSGSSTITVTTSSTTVFAKTVTGTVGDLTVGQPVAVEGTPASDGSITALTIEQATTGLGRFPGFGFLPGPGPIRGPLGFGGPGGGFGGPGAPPTTSPPTTTP